MAKPSRQSYDVVIIGAGIGGLVCGCYLAKAGLKVLIVEQHNKPGGYCTSFKRRGYTFDAAAHCFGSFRKDGIMDWVFEHLDLKSRIKIKRTNPSDIIIAPEKIKISFYNDINKTIAELKNYFPKEANKAKKFFTLILENSPQFFSSLRNLTFKDLLDRFFTNENLKKIFSFPFIGLGGLPASRMSAFVGTKLFSEFLLDGGYYPVGGMQELPNILTLRFKELNGKIIFSKAVKRIKTYKNKVVGVILDSNEFVPSKYVISNCDARQTFFKLINRNKLDKEFLNKLSSMTPSTSNFILYIGLKKYSKKDLPPPGTSIWFMKNYDYEIVYDKLIEGKMDIFGGCMIRVLPNKNTLMATIPAPFKTKAFWEKNKDKVKNSFIKNIQSYIIPNLDKYIDLVEAATPQTLYRYTFNYKGASFGWAGTPDQFGNYTLRKPSFIKNLFLVGHWTTLGIGISGVAYTGYDIANLILKRMD